MSRTPRTRRALWLVVVAGLAGVGVWQGGRALRSTGGRDLRDVPTFQVAKAPFVRTISGEGILKPRKTSVVFAPTGVQEPLMVATMLQDGDPVKQGDVIMQFDHGEASRRLADGESDREAAESKIQKEETASDTLLHDRDRTTKVTKNELASAKQLGKKDPRFFPRNEVIESEIDQDLFAARLDHAKRARHIEEHLKSSKLGLLAIERRKAEMIRHQARATLHELEIRAPHDGTFILRRWGIRGYLRPGDRVYPGMRLGEVSTSLGMDAEVYVLEADAGGLQAGQSATVVLEAQPDKTWQARVQNVETFPKRRQPEIPAQYFNTILAIEGSTGGLKSGQRLHATITLEEQASALVVPRQAVFRQDNDTIVYRRAGGTFQSVKVKLGPGTPGRLVIAEGVEPGDLIALRDPAQSADEAVADKRSKGAAGAGMPRAPGPGGIPR